MEESGCDLILRYCLSICLESLRKATKTAARLVNVLDKTPNISQKCYHLSQLAWISGTARCLEHWPIWNLPPPKAWPLSLSSAGVPGSEAATSLSAPPVALSHQQTQKQRNLWLIRRVREKASIRKCSPHSRVPKICTNLPVFWVQLMSPWLLFKDCCDAHIMSIIKSSDDSTGHTVA